MTHHHRAVLALALLLGACKPQATPEPAAPAATQAAPTAPVQPASPPATNAAGVQANGAVADADQALQRLVAQLRRDALYPDNCVSYASEDDAGASDGFTFVVRERHGDGCPGDPQTAPVRDRFRVDHDGTLHWYDVVDGDYVDYTERSARLGKLDAG
jgi:hypothetical protein